MVSVSQDSPIVRPMAFTVISHEPRRDDNGTVIDDPVVERVYLDAAGSVRIEQLASLDATEPETWAITTSDRHVELARQGTEAVWIEDIRPWDPLDWVFVTTAAYIGVADRGCEMLELDPSAGWEYVGLEEILGRPVHHVRCDGDFWVDAETRLVLRKPSSDQPPRTKEVTSLDLAPQPAALFDPTKPDGLRTVTRDEQGAYEDERDRAAACAADPICSAPVRRERRRLPRHAFPRRAEASRAAPRARAARQAAPPLHVTLSRWRSRGGEAGQDHLDYLGSDRYRVDWGVDPVAGTPAHTGMSAGVEERYESRIAEDGSVTWRRLTGRGLVDAGYMWLADTLMSPPEECQGGLRGLGVDRVGGFTTDHVECDGMEYWIDRSSSLVVRRQTPPDEMHGIEVIEVIDLSFGPTPDDRVRLPEGATIEPIPTPDPNFIPTAPPQPAPAG